MRDEYDRGEKRFEEQLQPFIPSRNYKNNITAYLSAKLLKTNLNFKKDELL